MGTNRDDGLDEAAAERLLAGHGGQPRRLADLLAAASSPPGPGELAGEHAAIAAFRSADPALAPGTHRRGVARPRWARLLTAKVGGVALVLAAGGVALAAGTGVLPGPLDQAPPAATSDPSRQQPAATTLSRTPPGRTTTAGPPAAGATPDPSLHGLCRAYLALLAAKPGEIKDNPAFAALVAAAGGASKVTSFCEALLDQATGAGANHGTAGENPSGTDPSGTDKSGTHPSGKDKSGKDK